MKMWTIMECAILTKVHKQVPGFHQHFLRTVYKFSYILWIVSLLTSTATAQNFGEYKTELFHILSYNVFQFATRHHHGIVSVKCMKPVNICLLHDTIE